MEIGAYSLRVEAERTKKEYEAMVLEEEQDMGVLFFRYLMEKAPREALAFLEKLGIDEKKITLCRPLTEPDERGEILYLACAPFCGAVLAGGETEPRQSEEIAGMSVIFVGAEKDFSPALPRFAGEMAELRFVIPLPFDGAFFDRFGK